MKSVNIQKLIPENSETWEPPKFWKKTLSEWKGHSRSNSRNSGAFSEQFSEWHSRPYLCENPILGATLGATLGIGWTPKFQPKFSELFFSKLGGSRAPEETLFSLCGSLFVEKVYVLFGPQYRGFPFPVRKRPEFPLRKSERVCWVKGRQLADWHWPAWLGSSGALSHRKRENPVPSKIPLAKIPMA